MAQVNPWDDPIWHGFSRESSLASSLICSGINGLGRADYADRAGEYYVAFFALSAGIERLGKIIWSADRFVATGKPPEDRELRSIGHDISSLVRVVGEIADRRVPRRFEYPDDLLTGGIVDFLDSFAAASKGRYANFATISGEANGYEPVALWWTKVVTPILNRHFAGTAAEDKAEMYAHITHAMLNDRASIVHWNETGDQMTSIHELSMRSARNEVAQKYGRFYTLRLVRWMSDVYKETTNMAHSSPHLYALFGHHEWFSTFLVEDRFLRERKVWPLR
ncbi:hypothetical protein ACFO6V_17815 [Promicromonospora alba]|uniref:Uncharacterized protein n=1 Tax=Promicromonospora alba TaxID=1616110 RepID=A0ABV9HMJ5_9MICO